MANKRVGRYPKEFRRMVEPLKNCDNIVAVAKKVGGHRRLLYEWRDLLDPAEIPEESLPRHPRIHASERSQPIESVSWRTKTRPCSSWRNRSGP